MSVAPTPVGRLPPRPTPEPCPGRLVLEAIDNLKHSPPVVQFGKQDPSVREVGSRNVDEFRKFLRPGILAFHSRPPSSVQFQQPL